LEEERRLVMEEETNKLRKDGFVGEAIYNMAC